MAKKKNDADALGEQQKHFKAMEQQPAPKQPNFALYAFLMSCVSFLLLAVLYVHTDERLSNVQQQVLQGGCLQSLNPTIQYAQDSIASSVQAISASSPFCYVYQGGQKKLAIDMTKISTACPQANATQAG